jgi:hypothetical protein
MVDYEELYFKTKLQQTNATQIRRSIKTFLLHGFLIRQTPHNLNYLFFWLVIINIRSIKESSAGRDIVVGMATRYGLEGPGIELR